MDYSVQRLQFLDLTDVTDYDQSLLERVLFSSNQVLEVPWYIGQSGTAEDQAEQDWGSSSYSDIDSRQELQTNNSVQDVENENEQHCDREEEGNHEEHPAQPSQQEQIPRQGGIFPGHPPTSLPHQPQPMFQMYQMVPSLSNVYVSNVTANVNVHAPYVQPISAHYAHQIPPQQQQPPQQMYTHGPPEASDQGNRNRRQRQKGDKKRESPFVQANEVMSPSLDSHPPPQFTNIHPMQPYYIPGTPGAPVYMQHAVLPVYHPPAMFSPYSHSPGPLVYPQANNLEPGNEEYHENVQQNFHQGGLEVVVVGCPIRTENTSEQRRGMDNEENYENESFENRNRQVEEPQEHAPDSVVCKNVSENVRFQEENQTEQSMVPVQNRESLEKSKKVESVVNFGESVTHPPELQKQSEGPKQTTFAEQTTQFASAAKGKSTDFQTNAVEMPPQKKANGNVNNGENVNVNKNVSVAAWGMDELRQPVVASTEANKVKMKNASGAEVVKVQESPIPAPQQNSEFPLIGQNVKPTRSSFTSPEPEGVTASQVTPSSGGKSWASLFTPTPNNRGRPLARVSPYLEGENANSGLPCTGQDSTPLLSEGGKPERSTMARTNGGISQETIHNSVFINDPHLHNLGVFLCNYELEHKIVSLQPRGLTNRSNWCYVNAILQSLIACPPFYNLLKALPVSNGKKGNKQTLIMDALVEYVNEFNLLPANARIGKREKSARNKEESIVEIVTGPAFEPSGIYRILDKVRGESSFNVEGRQEDAEEFLSCLLNGLNDEMLELMKVEDGNKLNLSNGDANGSLEGYPEDDESEWNVMGPKNKSSVTRRAVCGKTPISDIFRGQFRSRVQRAGDQSTDTVQPFFTLQLDIEKTNSVKDALELFMGRDPLEGVTCSRTHQEVEAWTQTTLEDLPLVLILHLKCYDYKSDACSKIIKSVDFQVDLKIDAKLLSNRNKYTGKQRTYKLVAVVYHDGKEASKGHYVTDAYHVGYGCWLRYDDVVVRSVPESNVLKPRPPRVPYLLYYRRADTIGPTK